MLIHSNFDLVMSDRPRPQAVPDQRPLCGIPNGTHFILFVAALKLNAESIVQPAQVQRHVIPIVRAETRSIRSLNKYLPLIALCSGHLCERNLFEFFESSISDDLRARASLYSRRAKDHR